MELAEERIGEYEDERNNDSDNRNRFYQTDADKHGSEELPCISGWRVMPSIAWDATLESLNAAANAATAAISADAIREY